MVSGLPSHMDSGCIFGLLGLWHIFSTLRCYISNPQGFQSRAWFPTGLPGRLRALELWTLLVVLVIFIPIQLSHAKADFAAGYIHSEHLMRFQHAAFSLMYLVYICVALVEENSVYLPLPDGALQGTFALGFLSELIVFHFGHHPGDDLESYVHMLMQLVLGALVLLMFLEIVHPFSFVISAARAMCLTLKGTWFFHIGVLINISSAVPMGCSIEEGHDFPSCQSPMDRSRAKSLQILILICQGVAIVALTYTGYGALRWILRDAAGTIEYEVLEVTENTEKDPAMYIVEDKDGHFAEEAARAGVPILKDMQRSLSRRSLARSAANTPVTGTNSPHVDTHSPLAKTVLMVQSPLAKNLKRV